MNVLALAPLPVEAAATRLRLVQLQGPLKERGIDLTVHPFVDSATYAGLYDRQQAARTTARLARAAAERVPDLWRSRRFDAVLVQREAMLFGPPLVERAIRTPIVLDLDDATYVAYDSPTYGRLGRWLKTTSKKTDRLIDLAVRVTAGSRTVADYAVARGTPATLVPTVVDLQRWTPRPPGNPAHDPPVIGWVGSHSTYPYLETVVPALQRLARDHRFRLLIVGSGRTHIDIEGLDVDNRPWRLDTEIADFQSIDIGLYPLPPEDPWAQGKSGLKAVQYMAVGVPYVASPVGAAAHIGEPHRTHLQATTPDEWHHALGTLLDDPARRQEMGHAGRAHAEANYTLAHAADPLAQALREAAATRS